MFECRVVEESGFRWICLEGRIDAMSAPDVEKTLNAMILEGERFIGADLERVNYISSAGLRVFIGAQKQVRRVGGEVMLVGLSLNILEVFKMSGFHRLFRFSDTRKEAGRAVATLAGISKAVSVEVAGIKIVYLEMEGVKGSLRVFGDHSKLAEAAYRERDVVRVSSKDVSFGVGLGALGDQYEHYKGLFGEAMVIKKNFFFYPAVKNPAVDYMLCSQEDSTLEYNFLHGFAFDGSFKYVVSFEGPEGFVELSHLVNALFAVSRADLLGMVILAQSKGVWGMHLRKVPIIENRPKNGKNIFESENFSEWLSFPIEPVDVNHVVAGTGIAMRHKDTRLPLQKIMAEENNFHFHAGVFSKAPLSKKLESFEEELKRVTSELDVYKVQHMLGKTRFSGAMAGIVELEG